MVRFAHHDARLDLLLESALRPCSSASSACCAVSFFPANDYIQLMATAPAQTRGRAAEKFSLRERVVLWAVSWAGYLAIKLIAPTLRWRVAVEDGGPEDLATIHRLPAIYVFWHRCVFPATYFWRNRQIQVMTSASFDGEYIARIIEKFGYGAVRGSSTRGGVRALLGMHSELEAGRSVAFTIDGPRGPIFVAKPGAALLARNTGAPILPFHIVLEDPWTLNSWDRFMIPKPFTHAVVRIGKLIHVPAEAGSAALAQHHADLQSTLDRMRARDS